MLKTVHFTCAFLNKESFCFKRGNETWYCSLNVFVLMSRHFYWNNFKHTLITKANKFKQIWSDRKIPVFVDFQLVSYTVAYTLQIHHLLLLKILRHVTVSPFHRWSIKGHNNLSKLFCGTAGFEFIWFQSFCSFHHTLQLFNYYKSLSVNVIERMILKEKNP